MPDSALLKMLLQQRAGHPETRVSPVIVKRIRDAEFLSATVGAFLQQ
jgi:hypothetical protein